MIYKNRNRPHQLKEDQGDGRGVRLIYRGQKVIPKGVKFFEEKSLLSWTDEWRTSDIVDKIAAKFSRQLFR